MSSSLGTGHKTAGLGKRTAAGFSWLLLQTGLVKIATSIGQVILAAILTPKDFGLVALAYSVTLLTSFIRKEGIREVLIQRRQNFRLYQNPALWLSLVIGLLIGGIMLIAAPVAARIYHQPELIPMLLWLAINSPFDSLQCVPLARLQMDMRFKAISALGVIQSILQMLMSIGLALDGFGALSFIIPIPVINAFELAVLWYLAKTKMKPKPQIRRWKSIFGASSMLMMASTCNEIARQAPNVVLGLFYTAHVVGIYFFSFNLSLQARILLTINAAQVLLPSFSLLQKDPKRQIQAFSRVTKMMVVFGLGFSLTVAAAADPGLHLLFGNKWIEAIPVLQILAIGTGLSMNGIITINLLQAQGQFKAYLWLSIVKMIGFVIVVTLMAKSGGGAIAVAAGTAASWVLMEYSNLYVAFRLNGLGWSSVFNVTIKPTVIGLASFGIAYGLGEILGHLGIPRIINIGVIILSGTGIYAFLIRKFEPEFWKDIWERLLHFLPQTFRKYFGKGIRPAVSAS